MPDFSPILQYMLDNNNSEHMDKATQTDFSESSSSTKQLTTSDKAGIPKLKVAHGNMETSSSSPPDSISAMSITGSPPPTSPSSPTLDIIDADPEMEEETQSDMSLVMEEEEKEEGKKEPKKKSERDHQLIGLMNKEKQQQQQQQQMPEELQQSELLHKSDGDGDWRQMILDMVMDASTWLKLPEQGFFRIFLVGNF